MGNLRWVPLLAAMTLLATACLQEGGGEGAEGGEGGEGAGGGTVTVLGAFTADEQELFEESIAPFEEESGITVEYEGSADFNTLITTRVAGGDAPDVAIFPQPGLLLDIADQTEAPPISEYLDIATLEESLIPGFLDATTSEGEAYGVPMRMAVKSVLWYPVPQFEEAGYTLPETQADLDDLVAQITSDGGTPWCLGIESADATGWVGTDWIEESMLRLHGPEVYDQWVTNELPFDSPEVRAAFEEFGEVWEPEGSVLGGAQGVLSIPFGEAANPMFDDEPGCWLHRQGNFITGFFPDEVQEDLDANVGAAYYPPNEDGFDGNPVLAGGDLALLINQGDAAVQFMEFLSTAEFGGPWAEAGGWLSPHRGFDDSLFPNDVTRSLYQIGADADVLRFDGSDLMPGAVGTGSFWTAIVDLISGERDLDAVLTTVQESWPATGEGSAEETSEEASEEATP